MANELQDYVNEQLKKARAIRFAESDQLSLGELIAKCEAIQVRDNPQTVVFDFEYARPTGIDSWRGVYAELALSFGFEGEEMTLPDFIKMCRGAVGQEFSGYKGGDYMMTTNTPVWAANYGNSGSTAVIGVYDEGFQVVLLTGYRP